ncbi:MAG: toxin [Ignavibacteriales bacterium]|nr:toxin [Ignavibacteriales bacterium]
MKYFNWNPTKNRQLKNERNISFEIILLQIENGRLLDLLEHPNKIKYPNQKILVVEYRSYVYLVPMIESEKEYFLKTIIPSRKATKKYLGV